MPVTFTQDKSRPTLIKLIRGNKYDVVVVIGPSHRVSFNGVSVFSSGGYETPLGVVPVAEEFAQKLKI